MAPRGKLFHGVLEIPDLILSVAYWLWLGVVFTKRIGQRNWGTRPRWLRTTLAIVIAVAVAGMITDVMSGGR